MRRSAAGVTVWKLARSVLPCVLLMLLAVVVCASGVGPHIALAEPVVPALAHAATATEPIQTHALATESVPLDARDYKGVTLQQRAVANKSRRSLLQAARNSLALTVRYVTVAPCPSLSPAQSADGSEPLHSQESQRILDAALVPAVKRLGKPVELVVKYLHVCDDWAFLHARMRGSRGRALSYAGTPEQQAAAHGLNSDSYAALLRRDHGDWHVIADAIGPTDVPWVDWSTRYRAPRAIFPAAVSTAGMGEIAARCDEAIPTTPADVRDGTDGSGLLLENEKALPSRKVGWRRLDRHMAIALAR